MHIACSKMPLSGFDRHDGDLTRPVVRQICSQMRQKLQGKRWFSPPPTHRDLAPSASNEVENAMCLTHYHSPMPKSPTFKRYRGQNAPKTENMEGFGHGVTVHGFCFRPLGHRLARGHHMHRSMPNEWPSQVSLGPGKPKPSARMCTVSLICKKSVTV